jgi:glycosyltransferase involved in cell wall biosynthesis
MSVEHGSRGRIGQPVLRRRRDMPGSAQVGVIDAGLPDFSWPTDSLPRRPIPTKAADLSWTRVKVLHVITRFVDGSGGNTLLSVLGADQTRYELWVAAAPGGPLWERAERNGVATVKLKRLREVISPLDDLITLAQLFRLMRRERFSIVHTHSSKAGFLGRLAAWLARIPVIVHTIHGFAWHDFMSDRRRRSYVRLERLVRPMTHAFLAVAPQVAREAVGRQVAQRDATSVIPSAIELDLIPTEADERIRAELGIPSDAAVVGTVGRFDFQKAPLDFVRMAERVTAAHPRTRFVMVGEGELLPDAQTEAQRAGIEITFTGYRADAARAASCFDVYVVSSLYEGLGRALSEALASGRPVVATAVNGVVDVIDHGRTGLLAPPADPDTLARHVVWLLRHPEAARRMGRAAQARARELFEPTLMCGLIEQRYERLLGFAPTNQSAERARLIACRS